MSLGERIKYLREELNLTQEDLGKILNVSKPTISRYEANLNEPNSDTLIKISKYFNVSIDYLFGVNHKQNKKLIPILGTIRAGIPILAEENWEGQIDVPNDIKGDFALKITGDSMSWVGISEGDYAIFENSDIASHGDIVAAGVCDGDWYATLKFFINEKGKQLLRAANPNYEDIPLTQNHRIIGILVDVIKHPPSIYTYRDFLVKKDLVNTEWQDAVEKAISYGLNGAEMINLIELFSKVVKQVKQ